MFFPKKILNLCYIPNIFLNPYFNLMLFTDCCVKRQVLQPNKVKLRKRWNICYLLLKEKSQLENPIISRNSNLALEFSINICVNKCHKTWSRINVENKNLYSGLNSKSSNLKIILWKILYKTLQIVKGYISSNIHGILSFQTFAFQLQRFIIYVLSCLNFYHTSSTFEILTFEFTAITVV